MYKVPLQMMMMNSLLKFLAWAFSELFLMMYYYPPFFSSSLQIHLQFLVLFHSFLPVYVLIILEEIDVKKLNQQKLLKVRFIVSLNLPEKKFGGLAS